MCIYAAVRDAELEHGERVVLETDGFVALHPFASRRPFETWIAPKHHAACFGHVTDEAITDLAAWGLRTNPRCGKVLRCPWRRSQAAADLR